MDQQIKGAFVINARNRLPAAVGLDKDGARAQWDKLRNVVMDFVASKLQLCGTSLPPAEFVQFITLRATLQYMFTRSKKDLTASRSRKPYGSLPRRLIVYGSRRSEKRHLSLGHFIFVFATLFPRHPTSNLACQTTTRIFLTLFNRHTRPCGGLSCVVSWNFISEAWHSWMLASSTDTICPRIHRHGHLQGGLQAQESSNERLSA